QQRRIRPQNRRRESLLSRPDGCQPESPGSSRNRGNHRATARTCVSTCPWRRQKLRFFLLVGLKSPWNKVKVIDDLIESGCWPKAFSGAQVRGYYRCPTVAVQRGHFWRQWRFLA